MTQEKVDELLAAEESETLERKRGLDDSEVCQALIAFANDQAGRGRGWLILGQAPDKKIVGLRIGKDKAQLRIANIAKDRCRPAIPVSIEIAEREGKAVAIVEVRASGARPHFYGNAWVRVGSQTRRATDAEIVLMRAAAADRKVALLVRWFNEGKKDVILWQLPAPGMPLQKSPNVSQAVMVDISEDWVVLDLGGRRLALPFAEFNVGYDHNKDKPQLRYHGAP